MPFLKPVLSDSLCFFVGDSNHAITHPLLAFGLADLYLIHTRQSQSPSFAITSPSFLQWSIISIRHTIYSHCGQPSFARTKQIKAKTRNPSHENISLLRRFLFIASYSFSFEYSQFPSNLFTETFSATAGLCCLHETVFYRNGSMAPPQLKSLKYLVIICNSFSPRSSILFFRGNFQSSIF